MAATGRAGGPPGDTGAVQRRSPRRPGSDPPLPAARCAPPHARTGDAIAIAAYLGDDHTFDRAIARFAVRYADQTQADYHRLESATAAGEIDAEPGR